MRRAVVATAVLLVAASGVSCESPPATDAESPSATSGTTRLQVERPEGTVVSAGGVLLDLSDGGRGTADVQDAVVVFQGDTILAVGPASDVSIPADALRIDASGKWILPGLIDAFAVSNNQAYASGFSLMVHFSG